MALCRDLTFARTAQFLATALLLIVSTAPDGATAQKTKSWTIYHRILAPGNPTTMDWSVRGSVLLSVEDGAPDPVKLELTNEGLSEELARALSTDDTAWYQVKLADQSSDNAPEIVTSVEACHVRRANFRDEFVLQLDSGSAKALSVSYMPLVSPLAPTSCSAYSSLPETLAFDSKVSWETAVPGMAVGRPPPKVVDSTNPQPKVSPPPGLKWIPGRRKTAASGASSGQAAFDPQNADAVEQEAGMFGFFKRYWYIILPLLIMNLMSSAPADEPEADGAAASGGAAAPVAAVAGTAAAAAPPVRRRGKRG